MDTFGNYILVEDFVETSLGKIYKAIPIKGEVQINFLHLLNDECTKEPQANTIIKTYLAKWKNIKDINILNLIDFVEKDGKLGYIIEYQRGRLLSHLLSECLKEGMPIAYDQAVYLISRIVDAIVSVNTEDFIYGNLTSEMIFITFEGEIKLFPGVLRDLQTTPLKHSTTLEKYTRSLPEELKQGRAVKSRDQIYFLGLLFFEFLTRESFEIPGLQFKPEERLQEAKRGIGLAEGLPDNLYSILEKSLLNKENSYKNIEEMKNDIDDLITSGEYSPSTFNTAFLMHTIYRDQDEIDAKKDEDFLKIDRKQFEPKKKIVIPPPKPQVEEEKVPTFGIEEEKKEGKSGLFIGIGVVALVIIIFFGWFLTSRSGKAKEEELKAKEAEELKLKQLEEQNKILKEQLDKLQAEAKAKEEDLAKAKTPEEKAKAQKALEEAKQKLVETQKLQEQAVKNELPPKLEPKPEIAQKEVKSEVQPVPSSAPPENKPQLPQETKSESTPTAVTTTSQPETKVEEKPAASLKEGDFVNYVDLDTRPKQLNDVKPEYPPLARQNKVEGRVYVNVTIDENGNVVKAEVVKSPEPDFGIKDASLKAAEKIKFTPPLKNGVKVKTTTTLNFLFTMKGK